MRITTNLMAMQTHTQYVKNNNRIASAVQKLSSGYAINAAADDAAGLAISEKMRARIRGLDKSIGNIQQALSLIRIADGALSSAADITQRMRELAVQSASGTNNDKTDRTALNAEFTQLRKELDDIARNTSYNVKRLLDGSIGAPQKTASSGNTASSSAYSGTPALILGDAESYFNGQLSAVRLAAGMDAAALTDSSYTLSADYTDPSQEIGAGQIQVTATGENGQVLHATAGRESLLSLDSSTELKLDFSSEAGDVFTLTLNLSKNISSSTSNYDTLASNISRLGVAVTGGVGLTADSASERLAGISFQVGSGPEDTIEFSINAMDTAHLGIAEAGIDTQENASSAITASDYAIKRISGQRSNLGAIENTLNSKLENLLTEYENLVSAESLIRDVDFAKEITEFTKAAILQQVAVAMMAQANSIPENVLYLLRN